MQPAQGVTFVVPPAQECLASSPPRSSSSLRHPEWLPMEVVLVACPVTAGCLGTPHQGSGKGQAFLSSRMGTGFIPVFSAFLYSMGHGLFPGIISQSPCYGKVLVHWFCVSCSPAETP